MRQVKVIWIFILFLNLAMAEEERSLGKSPRGLLMGDAYTSIATDEFTLFYNPATLARHSGFSFFPLNPAVSGVNALKDTDRFTNIGSDPVDVSDAILDFPIHLGIDYAPGLKMGRFGLSAIVNYQTNMLLQNSITPVLDVDHRFDKGFIMGYGLPLFGNFRQGGTGEQLSIGFAIKYIQRESIYNSFNLTGLSLLDAISQSSPDDILAELGKINGSGWGGDFGVDYVNSSGAQTFTMGLSFLDFYTILHSESNPDDFEVQPQPMRVNFGTSYALSAPGGFALTFSADIKHLEQQMEFARRLHLGTEINLSPALSLLAGVNAVDNYSYGLQFNAALFKLYLGFYGTEIGEKLQQQESNRFLIYLSMLHFDFEP